MEMRSLLSMCLLLIIIIWGINTIVSRNLENSKRKLNWNMYGTSYCDPDMTLVSVMCGKGNSDFQIEKTINLLKSVLMFTGCSGFRLICFTDTDTILLHDILEEVVLSMASTRTSVVLDIRKAVYPFDLNINQTVWFDMWKPCSSLRLFFPSMLRDFDSVLYLDTDTLLLSPVELLWAFFPKMNLSQITALGPEQDDPASKYYGRVLKTPFIGSAGVNSGVMLMNLSRMRSQSWESHVLMAYERYPVLQLPDQDLINIILHDHPSWIMFLPYEWNFQPTLCMLERVRSGQAIGEGGSASLIHGSASTFIGNERLSVIYYAINDIKSNGGIQGKSLDIFLDKLESKRNDTCKPIGQYLNRHVQRILDVKNFIECNKGK